MTREEAKREIGRWVERFARNLRTEGLYGPTHTALLNAIDRALLDRYPETGPDELRCKGCGEAFTEGGGHPMTEVVRGQPSPFVCGPIVRAEGGEVERLTAERDEARRERDVLRAKLDELAWLTRIVRSAPVVLK